MGTENTDFLQNMMDETYLLVKRSEEQQKKFSENYKLQLESITAQARELKKTINVQCKLGDRLEHNANRAERWYSGVIKIGFGSVAVCVFMFLGGASMLWNAHSLYEKNDRTYQVIVKYRSLLPVVEFRNGQTYMKIVKGSEINRFVNSKGDSIGGTFAEIHLRG